MIRLVSLPLASARGAEPMLVRQGALTAVRRVASTADRLSAAVLDPARERTTALSAQLLAYADRGAVALPVADVLRAVAGRGALVASAARLARVGHTSGSDLLIGIALVVGVMVPESKDADRCLT